MHYVAGKQFSLLIPICPEKSISLSCAGEADIKTNEQMNRLKHLLSRISIQTVT